MVERTEMRQLISKVVNEYAKENRINIGSDAIEALLAPADDRTLRAIEYVDQRRLHDQIFAILNLAQRPIGAPQIRRSLQTVECHYLFFC